MSKLTVEEERWVWEVLAVLEQTVRIDAKSGKQTPPAQTSIKPEMERKARCKDKHFLPAC